MGLITSVDNIQKELEKQKKQQLIDKLQKQKQKEQKENLKRYKSELEIFLKSEFEKYFEIAGSYYIFEFYNRERKKEILNNYFDTIKEIDKNGFEKVPYKNELEQHFYSKYNKILKEAEKEQKQQEIYNLHTMPMEEEKQKKAKNNINIAIIVNYFFKILFFIIFFPLILILSIIFGTFKYMK